MFKILNRNINLGWIVNPFFLYCLSFSFAFFLYSWGWCDIYPKMSFKLILFILVSFIPFVLIGLIFRRKNIRDNSDENTLIKFPFNISFGIIILLGLSNIIYEGYLPILDNGLKYREFGLFVFDKIFTSLSIFLSVFFFHAYLTEKKKKLLLFIFIIIILQILFFRRYTIVWILISCVLLYFHYKVKIEALYIILGLAFLLTIGSFSFGLFGNKRSIIDEAFIFNSLGANARFQNLKLSHNHYMTYIYVSSPLANLQENIDAGKGFLNKKDLKSFIFYSLLPGNLTVRLDRFLDLPPPECNLISPNLIVGSYFMVSYYTLGWLGMILMLVFLLLYLFIVISITSKSSPYYLTTIVLLSTTTSLLIFDNMLIRLDVILMLFVYPFLFNYLHKRFYHLYSSNRG